MLPATRRDRRPLPGDARVPRVAVRVIGAVLLVVALAAAMSVDVVKTGYGVKSDEATYVMMALSVAYDHDLAYERRDLERFCGLYHCRPDGIFLKRGKQLRVRIDAIATVRALAPDAGDTHAIVCTSARP